MAAKYKLIKKNTSQTNHVAHSGYSPWSDKYGEFKRLTANQYKDIGANYKVMQHPKKKTITLWNGEKATVIDSELGVPLGFTEAMGYFGPSTMVMDEHGASSKDYYKSAFDGSHKTHDWDGECGHISGLSYSSYYQLLKVTFWNGDICIFFRVPSTVASELLHFAESGKTMLSPVSGKQKHVLGIRFWDLIRIRGTRHGCKYRFEYESKNEKSYRQYGYLESMPDSGTEHEGYDIKKLVEWKKNFIKENGREPTLEEFKAMSKELAGMGMSTIIDWRNDYVRRTDIEPSEKDIKDMSRVLANTSRKTNMGSGMDNLEKALQGSGKQIRVPMSKMQTTIDDLEDYFDGGLYNRDLTNKKVDSGALRKAYRMYMDGKDTDSISNELRRAGVVILPEKE